MHIAAALELQFGRRRLSSSAASAAAGDGAGAGAPRRGGWWSVCCPAGPLSNGFWGGKPHLWCLLALLVTSAMLCVGLFEVTRLTTHVLRSPCTVLGSEIVDVGTCTICDGASPRETCEVHPVATARLSVTYKPVHGEENVTGYVWYCKGRDQADPCEKQNRFLDQLVLDVQSSAQAVQIAGPVPCTVGEVFAYMQMHAWENEERQCYYSSRDAKGEDVWLSMPSPGLVDHAWFQKHLEYPVLLALGGLVLLALLLGCLALEGAELWASGLV